MLIVYPARFLKDKESGAYTVTFPDLPGCITEGNSSEEALFMAQKALAIYLYDLYLTNSLPQSSAAHEIKIADDEDDCIDVTQSFVSLVGVDMQKFAAEYDSKTIRKNLTVPAWLNTKAENAGINFSQTLQDALMKQLAL
jgi:predicted RNase H-like HicB family nuclease